MNIKYNKALWLVIILAIVMMIPFLGLSDFNTKGEPREAVVAYTMLEHGNWILPINNGGDIPYKPPFFHWCIAFFSLIAGHVKEYTSRLPSAVSLVLMTIGGFVFYAKRKDTQTSLIAAILTLTAFEVHRAGMNCRVDMVNSALMVGAMYLLYRWWEKGKHQLPWLAILCMSGATLTKGPVGIILPCFVMGWAPYTLLLLFSLFILPWKKFSKTRFLENAKKATPLQVFTWLAFLLVLFFYCIPKSKRSVYLLPCYPFMAYLIAEYIVWMMKEKMGAIKVYTGVIASLAIILVIATLVIRAGGIPNTIFHGKHAADNIAMLHAIGESTHGILFYVCYMFLIIGAYQIFKALKKKETSQMMKYTLVMIIAIFITLDSTLQPAVLNTKADKHLAPVIEKKFDTSKLYSYMSVDMLHFFSLNFYLGDKIQQFDKVLPQDGVLMIPEEDMPDFLKKYGKDYTFQKVWEVKKTVEWHSKVGFYKFVKTSANIAQNR